MLRDDALYAQNNSTYLSIYKAGKYSASIEYMAIKCWKATCVKNVFMDITISVIEFLFTGKLDLIIMMNSIGFLRSCMACENDCNLIVTINP